MDQALLLVQNELLGTHLTVYWNSERCYYVGILFMLTVVFTVGMVGHTPVALTPAVLSIRKQTGCRSRRTNECNEGECLAKSNICLSLPRPIKKKQTRYQ